MPEAKSTTHIITSSWCLSPQFCVHTHEVHLQGKINPRRVTYVRSYLRTFNLCERNKERKEYFATDINGWGELKMVHEGSDFLRQYVFFWKSPYSNIELKNMIHTVTHGVYTCRGRNKTWGQHPNSSYRLAISLEVRRDVITFARSWLFGGLINDCTVVLCAFRLQCIRRKRVKKKWKHNGSNSYKYTVLAKECAKSWQHSYCQLLSTIQKICIRRN